MERLLYHTKQTHTIFALLALVFGLVFIHIIPPMWGVDEIDHFDRAYQISKGQFMESKISKNIYGGKLPLAVVETTTATTLDLQDDKASATKDVDNPAVYTNLDKLSLSGKSIEWNFDGSAAYSPVAYAAPSIGIAIARHLQPTIGSVVFGARFATLILYIALVGSALYLLRNQKAKWLVFVIALVPMALFQASIVNVDSLSIGLAILLFAQVIMLWQQKDRLRWRQLALLFATAAWLDLTKPNYFLLTLICVLLPARLFTSRLQKLGSRFVLPVLAAVPAALWGLLTAGTITTTASQQSGTVINFSGQAHFILSHPITYLSTMIDSAVRYNWYGQMYSTLGFNFVTLPVLIVAFLTAVLLVAALYINKPADAEKCAAKREGRWLASSSLVWGVIAALSIAMTFYLIFNSVGANSIRGVQGRYFLPVLPFIAYGFCLLPVRVSMTEKTARILFPLAAFCSLLFAVLWYYHITY